MASTIKVDNVQNQPGTNIIDKCGTTITLGQSGDTIALACGASQTGFGRTGTVDWETSIQTGTVTAATGKGYFVNTTSGGITVNLPAGAVGSIVAISDYASTSVSNPITVAPNGSDKINGTNDNYVMSTKGLAVTLVYADAVRGWKSVTGSDADATGESPQYVTATGGTPCAGAIVNTNYKVHTFTGPGTFTVSCAGNALGSNTVDYMVVAGGGGGARGASHGGGGGAGGYRESPGTASGCYAVSPLGAAPAVALPVPAVPYSITVGAGGATQPSVGQGNDGNDSVFSTITSTAGGGGGDHPGGVGRAGGSGGGGAGSTPGPSAAAGGAGNTPPTNPAQGNDGGVGNCGGAMAAGGGATQVGIATPGPAIGGAGATSSINATPTARAGGGGGGSGGPGCGAGGAGGGGAGSNDGTDGGAGTVNTGGGGGGAGFGPTAGGAGGSGIVIIRYKFQ